MNFLAHCLLANVPSAARAQEAPGGAESVQGGLLAGAVLGDFVKGPVPDSLPPALGAGIRLHRRIDVHSGRLALMKASVRRFHPRLRRPAPVLLDLVADHCLTLGWRRHAGADEATADLGRFAGKVYAALDRFRAWVPPGGARFVRHLVETDLLSRYGQAQVVHRAMAHVLERLGFGERIELLDNVLRGDLPGFREDFARYFPLLRQLAATERAALQSRVTPRAATAPL